MKFKISPAEYKGFKLMRKMEIDGMPYFEFAKTLDKIHVLHHEGSRYGKLILKPVELQIVVRKGLGERHETGEQYDIVTVRLFGRPQGHWHPHVDGAGYVCWGQAVIKNHSKNLNDLLLGNLYIITGLLADFQHGGFNSPSEVLTHWTVRIISKEEERIKERERKRLAELRETIEPFSADAWNEAETEHRRQREVEYEEAMRREREQEQRTEPRQEGEGLLTPEQRERVRRYFRNQSYSDTDTSSSTPHEEDEG